MAVPVGTATTYSLTVGVKLDIEDMIYLVSPYDTPLLGGYGADGRSALSQDTCFEKMVQWLDETLLTPRSVNASTTLSTDTTIYLETGTGVNFQTGDLLVMGSEYILVNGPGTTADTILVTRAFSGTAAQYSPETPVVGVGQAMAEGGDAGSAVMIDRQNRYNMTQIFGPRVVQVSGSENAVQKYGLTGTEFDHQVANRVKEIAIMLEQAILYGTRTENSSTGIRTMGGITNFVTTNVDNTTTLITETALLNQLQACYDAGGFPDRLVTGSKQKRNLSAINEGQIRYVQDTNVRGQKVERYESDFGSISLVLDRWCRTSDLFIFGRDQATVKTLRPLQFEPLAKTGDSTKGQILAEKTFEFRTQSHAALFNALT